MANAVPSPAPGVSTARAPTLTVGDLRLIPFADSDAADLAAAVTGDEGIARFSISLRKVRDEADALRYLASRRREGQIDWAIRDPDGRLVGRTALHDLDLTFGVGEIGYGVFAAFRRQGVANRVASAVTTYGFTELGLTRVELMHAVANAGSCAVANRCGFALEGEMRSALLHPSGGREDAHLHARLSTDPAAAPIAGTSPVELAADGLVLRPWRDGDAEFLLSAMDDPDINRWNPLRIDGRPIGNLDDARRLAARFGDWSGGFHGRHCSWVITDGSTSLGHLSVYDIDTADACAGVGYWVAPEARGHGVAAHALRVAADWAHGTLGLQRLELFHAVANPASCAVGRAAGFALEGTLRSAHRYGDGELHDEHVHARLADD